MAPGGSGRQKCNRFQRCSRYLAPSDIPKLIDFASFCLYYDCLRFIASMFFTLVVLRREHSVFSTKEAICNLDNNPFRELKVTIRASFGSLSHCVCVYGRSQSLRTFALAILRFKAASLRIEFDNHLRSRVVARFDKKETVMGPFTASETVTTADELGTEFLLDLAKTRANKRRFRRGRAAHGRGKGGNAQEDGLRHHI